MLPIELLIPEHLIGVRDLTKLHQVVRDELMEVENEILNLRRETVVPLCSEDTLRQFEREYALVPLQDRVAREKQIQSRLSNTQCLTDKWLNKKVGSYGRCRVERDYLGETIQLVYLETPIIPTYIILRELDDLLPMHIKLSIQVKPLEEQVATTFVHPLQRDYKEVRL